MDRLRAGLRDDVLLILDSAYAEYVDDPGYDAGARMEQGIRTCAWGRIAVLADPFGHGLCLIEFLNRGYDEIAEPCLEP